MGTFYFFRRNVFVILFITIFTFRFFTGRYTSVDRRSLRPLCWWEIRVLSFRFRSRLRFFLSSYSSLISLVVTFACWHHSFWWSFSTFFCFFNCFFLFCRTFASVRFSQIWWFVFRLLLFFSHTATAYSSSSDSFFCTCTILRNFWFNLKSFISLSSRRNRLTQLLSIWPFTSISQTCWHLTRLNFIRSIIVTNFFIRYFVITSLFVWNIGNHTGRLIFTNGLSTMATLGVGCSRRQLRIVFVFHITFLFYSNFGSINVFKTF